MDLVIDDYTTDPDLIFQSAKDLFNDQYPMSNFITAGESMTIELTFVADPIY